jgi:Domain of unknown function (DUF6487)
MAEITEGQLTCPRCGSEMKRGYLNAGRGPFRWVDRPDQHLSIFGGHLLAPRHWFWGRRVIPGARCSACRVGVFAYDAV